jgi:tetratricopeptide (TPR) repeat protein
MKPLNIQNKIIEAYGYDNSGQMEKAKRLCLEIIKIDPDNFEINKLLGIVEAKHLNYLEALKLLKKANAIKDTDPYLLNCIANVYQEIDEPLKAIYYYDQSIKIKANFFQAYTNRGIALKKIKKIDESLESFNASLKINPKDIDAYIGRGNLFFDENNYIKALQDYAEVIKINNKYAPAYFNSAIAYRSLREITKAIDYFDKAISLNKNYLEAYYEKSLTLLLDSQLEEGFELYEWRWKLKSISQQAGAKNYSQPLWLGKESIKNKVILLHAEQGLGDTIQFSRYCKMVSDLGAKVILEVPNVLIPLLNGIEGVYQIVAIGQTTTNFDYHAPLMSLPFAFCTNLETIPNQNTYLKTNENKYKQWKQYIGDKGFKIAISWQGSKKGDVDIGRSFPVNLFEEISKINGVRLISLQKNEGTEQLTQLPVDMKIETLPESFDSMDGAFLDSAAVLKCVDLVITSDTALTHLAGALGVNTWLPLKYVPDWRWMLDRSDTPWYPAHRLFRQKQKEDWVGVFKEMKEELMLLTSEENKVS